MIPTVQDESTRSSALAVAIPVYNGADYLEQAIRSSLTQTLMPCEIRIVDDASTDATATVISSFNAQPLIRSTSLRARLPAPGAWNAAVRCTSAPHLVILAHDDLLEPDFLKVARQAIDAHRQLDLLAFGHQCITSAGEPRDKHPMRDSGLPVGTVLDRNAFLDRFCSRGQMFLPSAVVMSRRIFDAVGGFDERLKVAYDWDFYLRAAAAGASIILHPEVMCRYRIHQSQSVASFTRRDNGDNSIIFEKLEQLQKTITAAQLRMLIDGMCEFMRQMVSRALRDPRVAPGEILSLREDVCRTMQGWRHSPLPYASLVKPTPRQLKKRIVWQLAGSRLGIATLRRMLRVNGGGA